MSIISEKYSAPHTLLNNSDKQKLEQFEQEIKNLKEAYNEFVIRCVQADSPIKLQEDQIKKVHAIITNQPAQPLRAMTPGLPIIIVTGYWDQPEADFSGYKLLSKPSPMEDLIEAVEQLL